MAQSAGKADNTLYCFDPDWTPYPVMQCHHQTCAERQAEDFVSEMIAQGELDRDDVFNNPDYRDAYDDLATDLTPPDLPKGWRKHI